MPKYKVDFYLSTHKGTTIEAEDADEAYEKALAELKINKEEIEDIEITDIQEEN